MVTNHFRNAERTNPSQNDGKRGKTLHNCYGGVLLLDRKLPECIMWREGERGWPNVNSEVGAGLHFQSAQGQGRKAVPFPYILRVGRLFMFCASGFCVCVCLCVDTHGVLSLCAILVCDYLRHCFLVLLLEIKRQSFRPRSNQGLRPNLNYLLWPKYP